MNIGDDAVEADGLEAVPEHGQARLGCKAVAPGRAQKPPADLDLGADCIIGSEQHPANERGGHELEDDGPIAEAGRIFARDAVDNELAMLLRRAPRHVEIAQHGRIAIHGEAGVQVRDLPRADEEPLRLEAGQHGQNPAPAASYTDLRNMPATRAACSLSHWERGGVRRNGNRRLVIPTKRPRIRPGEREPGSMATGFALPLWIVFAR